MSSSRGGAETAGTGRRRRFSVDALFDDHRPQATGVTDLATAKEILLDRIVPDPEQPRRTFDPEKLEELAGSIRIEGVLQPIVVRYDAPNDTYVVVHGERRWRAARLAGLDRLPAIVREVPAERRLIQQLMENIVRDDLNAVDRAAALRVLKVQLDDAPWEAVAEAVGIRRSRLFQLLGTEKLPETIQDDIRSGRLSEKQSRALQGLPAAAQEALREAIVADGIPAAEALRVARELRGLELADDPAAASAAIGRLREPAAPMPPPGESAAPSRAPSVRPGPAPDTATAAGSEPDPNDVVIALLEATAGAATLDPRGAAALERAVAVAGVPVGAAEGIADAVRAMAWSLARLPGGTVRHGDPAHRSLVALRDALHVLVVDGDA